MKFGGWPARGFAAGRPGVAWQRKRPPAAGRLASQRRAALALAVCYALANLVKPVPITGNRCGEFEFRAVGVCIGGNTRLVLPPIQSGRLFI